MNLSTKLSLHNNKAILIITHKSIKNNTTCAYDQWVATLYRDSKDQSTSERQKKTKHGVGQWDSATTKYATGSLNAQIHSAMSPKVKWRLAITAIILSVIVILYLILSRIPTYIYFFVISACAVVCYYKPIDVPFLSRLGLNPRHGLTIPAAFLNWLPGWSIRGESTNRRRNRTLPPSSAEPNNVRLPETSINSPDSTFNCTFYPRYNHMDREYSPSRFYGKTTLSSTKKRLSYG